ncbi:MAG: hypothetical protein WAT79_02595, partial [Saprospiraceae bacterium]
MKTSIIIAGLLLISLSVNCQSICNLEDKVELLHANNIRAAIRNKGMNFQLYQEAGFKVPYKSYDTPGTIYETGLWFGAYDSAGNLLTNVLLYKGNNDCGYVPGPWMDGTDEENYINAKNWNKIFKVTGEEILAHKEDYLDGKIDKVIEAIYAWPGKGNPFFKQINGFDLFVDSHAGFQEMPGHENGIYEPHFGEYPA